MELNDKNIKDTLKLKNATKFIESDTEVDSRQNPLKEPARFKPTDIAEEMEVPYKTFLNYINSSTDEELKTLWEIYLDRFYNWRYSLALETGDKKTLSDIEERHFRVLSGDKAHSSIAFILKTKEVK